MEFYDYIKEYFENTDINTIRVNFHTTNEYGRLPEEEYKKDKYMLDYEWNNYVIKNDYSDKTNIYIISFYQLKENNKNFVLNGIFFVDDNNHFWKLYDDKIYKQYGKMVVEYDNRKNNYPLLSTVIEKGCKIIYMKKNDDNF